MKKIRLIAALFGLGMLAATCIAETSKVPETVSV